MTANVTDSLVVNVTQITTDIATAILNETTTYMMTALQMTSNGNSLHCDNNSVPCSSDNSIHCYNGGICCEIQALLTRQCKCPMGWEGSHCQKKPYDDDDYSFEESRERKLAVIGMSSIFSLIVGLLALSAFVVLAILILRKKLSLRQTRAGIDQNLTEIEEELNKMPTVTKLRQLSRLSKKFEASARATVEEAIHSAAVVDSLKLATSLSPSARDCLPRWSSAPSCLLTTVTETSSSEDVPDGAANGAADNWIPLIDRRRLQALFSYPA